jgi:hypothetical protein
MLRGSIQMRTSSRLTLGDFARMVTSGHADLDKVARYVSEVHPEMLPPPFPRPRRQRNAIPKLSLSSALGRDERDAGSDMIATFP